MTNINQTANFLAVSATGLIDALASTISKIKTEIANIEETYRKLKEEAEKNLSEQLKEAESQYSYWLTVRGDLPVPEKKTRRSRKAVVAEEATAEFPKTETTVEEFSAKLEETPIEEEEPVVVDTLFEDNNVDEDEISEEEVDDFAEDVTEEESSSSEEEEKTVVEPEWPENIEEW